MTCHAAEDGDEFPWLSTDLTSYFLIRLVCTQHVAISWLADGQWYKELNYSALGEGLLGFCSPRGEPVGF